MDLGDGLVADDEDAVLFDGASFTPSFDGSSEGVAPELDLDAVGMKPSGALLVSFDGSGSVGGVDFDDDTVLQRDGATWTALFEVDSHHPGFEGGDMVALPEPGSALQLAAGTALLLGLALRSRRRDRWGR